jgi:hypothetical protein
MKYTLDSDQKVFKKQLRAFINDTGWIGIFKKNLTDADTHDEGNPKTIVGEESLGITKSVHNVGQLVKIRFDGKTFEIET